MGGPTYGWSTHILIYYMKYLLFILSIIICLTLIVKIVNLRFAELTNYGWGYFTGYAIFLLAFSFILYSSGKRIFKEPN